MTLTQAMETPFRQTTYTEQEEEQIRKRVEESIKQKIDAMSPVRGKQEIVEVNNQTFKVDSLDTVQQKNNIQVQKAVELATPLLEKQEENTEPLDTTPFANKNYSYKDVESFAEEQGMSVEQANENAIKLIKENPVGTLAQNTATTNSKIWKGLDADFKSIDAYDYKRKEQTNEQKAWESFVRSAKEARSTDELMLTQGQKLGEFRTKATELTDILWNMYSSAGTTKKVDRVYGATLDAYLSAFFGKSISEIAENREKYKTLVMGRNVDDVSTLEAMGRAFQSDSLSTRIAMNEWMYFITKDSHYNDNVDELLKVQQRFYTDYADRNKVSETFINAMPILAQGLKMWATLLITGGIGSAIGSAVGMKKVLGDAVSASLYSTIGQKIGIGVGYGLSATDTFMREGGSAMVELSQLRDSLGNKLDDDLVLKAGILTGLVNTFWEYLTPEPFTKKMTSFNFKSVLKSGFASSLGNFLLNSLAGGISESSEELLQTATSDALSWAFKKISNEYNGTTFDLSEDSLYNWFADGIKSFGQAFFPSMLVGMAGTGRAYVQDVIKNVVTNEDYRKNFKTEALRTLDTYTTPENSTYNYRKEAETNQVVPSRNSRIVSEFGLSIEGGKLSKEARQQIREQYENEDGKMPAIVVKWDSSKKMYVPIDEANNKIAQYLYSDKRAKGFVIEYRNAESVHYPTSTVSILTRNNKGSFDQTNSTITFDTSRDRENFLTNFEGEIMTDLDSTTTELKVKDQDGNDVTYTVKLSEKAKQENTGVDTSYFDEDSNTTNNIRTRKVKDQEGKTYEVFDKSDVIDMISYALPSMSEREASAIAEWINLLPANIQDSIIQKLKKENGDIRDFIVSADDYAMEHNNNPELMKKLEKGRAIALINEARIVLKDGKTRGKDVVHEVFHVLWNLFPEYRSDLVKGVTTTLKDTASREQLKRWYEDNRDALNSLKGNKFKNETVGQVNSWESFLSLLETVSDEKVEADIQSGNPAIEELFARMSTAILIDPSEGAMNSLPSTLKDIFKKIVQKLKSLYKGLIGEFNNRNFAPRTLEDAVLSIYQDENTYTATDNLNQRFRYSEELEGGYDNTAHMSNRAVRAYENSEMPISKWNGQALDEAIEYTSDASQEVVDILKSLPVEAKKNLLKWSSWHHTGIFFNETDFYTIGDLSDVSVKDAETYRDEWNQYKKDKREYPKKLEEIKLGLKENQELKESYSGKMQIVTYKNAFENVSIPSSISEFASNSLEYSRSGNAYKMFQKPNSEEVKNGLERLEISEDGKSISLTKYNADKKAYETIDSVNLPIETTTEDLHNYMKGKYQGSIVSKEDVDIKKPYAPYLYHTEEVRYSEELEDDDTQDYGDTFNVDNPKSIINRNIRTWDALVDSDVDQFIAQDVYLPTEVLKQHDSLKSVQQEIEDRNEIDLHLEI